MAAVLGRRAGGAAAGSSRGSAAAVDMLSPPDFYALLGVSQAADHAAIKAAYRREALLAHPDKGGCNENFHALCIAFEVLSNSATRAAYDADLASQIHKSRKLEKATDAKKRTALQRLQRCIANFPREERRTALDSLHPQVSEALLGWMQRKSEEAEATHGAPVGSIGTRSAGSCRRHAYGTSSIKKVGGNSKKYLVSMSCFNLLIASSPQETLEQAIAVHALMLDARGTLMMRFIEQQKAKMTADLVDCISTALSSASRPATAEAPALTFSLMPVISAMSEVGRKIYGQRTTDVGAACAQRAELLDAKERGWPVLRATLVKLLRNKSAGQSEAEEAADKAWAANSERRAKAALRAAKGQNKSGQRASGSSSVTTSPASSDVCEDDAASADEIGLQQHELAQAATQVQNALAAEQQRQRTPETPKISSTNRPRTPRQAPKRPPTSDPSCTFSKRTKISSDNSHFGRSSRV
eukprot:TRINITY_DN50912_c2_g2_i1.p1 TRINITY_DN50912_c2_g2~~TRINITY_DN50912_c2_g2_i1.p1  ORF type:complete len:470 (+),score=107.26 TRINITY_DN50912_c2_g2_i1:228-1637(+)